MCSGLARSAVLMALLVTGCESGSDPDADRGTASGTTVEPTDPTEPTNPVAESVSGLVRGEGFTINLPEGWVNIPPAKKFAFLARSPVESTGDLMRENSNMVVMDLAPGVDLQQAFEGFLADFRSLFEDYEFDGTGVEVINGQDARWHLCSASRGAAKMKVLQYLFVVDQKAYILAFNALPETYPAHEADFRSIARSILFE